MAEMERKNSRYTGAGVGGSLAYDFDERDYYTYSDLAYEPQYGIPVPSETDEQALPRRAAVRRTKQSIAPAALLGYALAAAVIICALFAQIQLMTIADKSVALSERISALQEEQTKLQIAYESAFNLSDIETYATDVLGMQKPMEDQIYFIESSASDKAVVLAENEEEESFLDKLFLVLNAIGEYFG